MNLPNWILVRGDIITKDRLPSLFECFTLDASVPIIAIVDSLVAGESAVCAALQTGLSNALKLLVNMHGHFNVKHRQNVLKSF